MRLLFPAAGILLLCPFAIGCASSANTEEELSKLRREMASMRRDLTDTKVEVERLEGRVTLLALGRDQVQPPLRAAPTTAPVATTRAEPSGRAGSARKAAAHERVLPVVRLGAKAETPDSNPEEGWVDPGAQDDGQAAISLRLSEHDKDDKLAVDRDVLKKPDPNLAAGDEKAAYDDALRVLREEGKPSDALARFTAFREKNPGSKLALNASYWIGECHFQLKAYERAIAELDALVREFPRADKVPDALVRSGESWLLLDNRSKGRALLERVVREYPETAAAERAKARLEAEGGH